jgi:hypothetical protein
LKTVSTRRLITIAAAAMLALPAAASARLIVGLGDQKPDMFGDPRFLALNITHVRLSVPWDVLNVRSETAALDRWLRRARRVGMVPLISFDHSQLPGHHKVVPTARQFRHQFGRFHARYPWIVDYATWNEANYCGEITCHHPAAVASYYHVMRRVCPSCHVLAAELLDVPGMLPWVRKFLRYAKVQPHYWGLHNYVGANRLSDVSTRLLLRSVHGDIWFTETAGLVARHNASRVNFPQNAPHAAKVTYYIFDHLARLSPRIQRVYLYQWNAVRGHDGWDSALIDTRAKPRQAYDALAEILVRLGVLPNCRLWSASPACLGATDSPPPSRV